MILPAVPPLAAVGPVTLSMWEREPTPASPALPPLESKEIPGAPLPAPEITARAPSDGGANEVDRDVARRAARAGYASLA